MTAVSGVMIAYLSPEKMASFFNFGDKYSGLKAYLLCDDGFILYGTGRSTDIQERLQSNNPKGNIKSHGDDHHLGEDEVHEYSDHMGRLVFGDIHTIELQNQPTKVLVEIALTEALKPLYEFRKRLLLLILITTLTALGIAYLVTLNIINPVKKLTNRVLKVKDGHYGSEKVIRSYSEITILSENFEHMVQQTGALLNENQDKTWLQQGQVDLHEAISGNIDIQTLTENTLTFIARYLNLNVGAFYVLDASGKFVLTASYARPKSGLKAHYKLGEGLVGQAAQDMDMLEIVDEGDVNMVIESATGTANPGSVIAIPVVYDNAAIGVMVYARIVPMKPLHNEFLSATQKIIVMALHSARQRELMR